ncbi:MAG: DUF6603 domain-containing protein [Bryobacteraceae bacterium]|jgi:hypothetical protein
MPGTVDRAGELLSRAVRPLGAVSGDIRAAGQLLALLGWSLPPGVNDIGLSLLDVSTLTAKLDALTDVRSRQDASDDEIAAAVAAVVLALKDTLQHLENLTASLQATPEYLSATHIVDEFFPRLADLLVIQLVGSAAPGVVPLGVLLGLFEFNMMPADPTIFQVAHMRQVVRWDRFGPLFTDPAGLVRDVYGWGTPHFDGAAFVTNLGRLVEHFSDSVAFQVLMREVEERIVGHAAPEADTDPAPQLMISLVRELGFDAPEVGVALFPLRPTTAGGSDGGLGVSPYAFSTTDTTFELSDTVSLELATSADLEGLVALVLRPGAKPQLLTALLTEPDSGPSSAPASFTLTVKNSAPSGQRHVFFSAFGVTADAASVSAGIRVDVSEDLNPALFASVEDGRILLVPDSSDGFLASVLPKDGVTATVNLKIGYSHRNGLTIEGGAGLSTQLVLNRQLGPLIVNTIQIALAASPAGLTGSAAVTASVVLGPVTATIASTGASVAMAFERGNLGPVDLGAAFKPPDGVGLAVDAASVSGGGFLKRDPATHEYSGMLQLEFTDLALQAFALITTQPSGGAAYSLFALIDADFPPVQLGWGFTLDGVGGIFAVNRTASTDALRAAVKTGALSSILFPKAAIANAPQVLSQLDAYFPPAAGRFLFGPMALIGWGTPTLLTAAIAVVLELPEPVRIILLARLAARLPSESSALVRINMDALGVLDLSRSELALDAALFDSRLLSFTLTGSMALRAAWATQREFLLAIGGFHPQFTPPAGFPALDRITIDMPSGPVSKLRLAAYLAITSNTVQFGATLDVFIGVSGFGLAGHLGFDALLQLEPFHFEADISGRVALTAGGDDLMSVGLDATLSGPAPWNIAGKFKVHLLFFDVDKSFSHTWGEDAPAQQIAPVDVLSLVTAALADARNWGAQLAPGTPALVALRSAAQGAVVAHPLARLEVHESVVPLGLAITRFGAAAPAGATSFTITGYRINGSDVANEPIQDDFAPAQFFDLSDDEKLARPSFERHDAGVRTIGGLVSSGPSVTKTISYETFYVDEPGGALRTDPATPPKPSVLGDLQFILAAGSAGRAQIRQAGNRRYTAPGKPVMVAQAAFVVVDTSTLAAAGVGPVGGGSYSDVSASIAAELARNPARRGSLAIVATHEMRAA